MDIILDIEDVQKIVLEFFEKKSIAVEGLKIVSGNNQIPMSSLTKVVSNGMTQKDPTVALKWLGNQFITRQEEFMFDEEQVGFINAIIKNAMKMATQ